MFQLCYQGLLIGETELAARDDQTMGCAYGSLCPSGAFHTFQDKVPANVENDQNHRIWSGFSLRTWDGRPVKCVDVTLHTTDQITYSVHALGIVSPPFAGLFPQTENAEG